MNSLPIWNHTHTAINEPGFAAHPDFIDPTFVKPVTKEPRKMDPYLRELAMVKGSGKRGSTRLRKGSAEAKAYMARLRAMRGRGVRGRGVSKRTRKVKGGFSLADVLPYLQSIGPYLTKAWTNRSAIRKLLKHILQRGRYAVNQLREGQDMSDYMNGDYWQEIRDKSDKAFNEGKFTPFSFPNEGAENEMWADMYQRGLFD